MASAERAVSRAFEMPPVFRNERVSMMNEATAREVKNVSARASQKYAPGQSQRTMSLASASRPRAKPRMVRL